VSFCLISDGPVAPRSRDRSVCLGQEGYRILSDREAETILCPSLPAEYRAANHKESATEGDMTFTGGASKREMVHERLWPQRCLAMVATDRLSRSSTRISSSRPSRCPPPQFRRMALFFQKVWHPSATRFCWPCRSNR